MSPLLNDYKRVSGSWISQSSMFKPVFSTFLVIGILASCSQDKAETLVLQREWFPNSEYVGDVMAEELSMADGGTPIVLKPGGELLDPIAEVRTGRAQFGVASADRVLIANEKGAELVIIAAATARSPVSFVYFADREDISNVTDFEGNTVGIQKGTNTELVFEALVKVNSLQRSEITIVESGWNTIAFETGSIDIQAVFDYDEPVTLASKGIETKKIDPKSFGVDFIGTVYFTKRHYIAEHPDRVQRFLDLLFRGWSQVLGEMNADEAIELLYQRFPSSGVDRELAIQSLRDGKVYFSGDRWESSRVPLYAEPERWDKMAQTLEAMELIEDFSFSDNVDYSYLDIAAVKGLND